jgi:5S rRNA maturation endonuclease (ribonuclease M5)
MNDFAVSRDEIIERNPLDQVVRSYGIQLVKSSANQMKACCPFHDEKTPSFYVDTAKRLWKCFGCDTGGSVIDFVMRKESLSVGGAMAKLSGVQPQSPPPTIKASVVASYDYHDETGKLVYRAIRYNPKSFRQCQIKDGREVWNMDGARRVLYRLPKVLKAKFVWIVEGEKDADTLNALGFTATCNVGGAGKWMDGYTESVKGKEIVLCGDNDEPGRKHMELVLESIAGKVKSVRVVKVPEPFKDVSDYVASLDGAGNDVIAQSVFSLCEQSAVLKSGINLKIKSIADLEDDYQRQIKEGDTAIVNLGNWLRGFAGNVRGLIPGELVTIMADTGVGKTMILQNIAIACRPVQTLLFELELPGELTFERFAAIATGLPSADINSFYRDGKVANWRETRKLDHIYVCSEASLSIEKIRDYITKSELVTGSKPRLVLIDYIGLIKGRGMSRYEKLSTIAEDLKTLAKDTSTVVIVASQVRRDHERSEVSLHDAKDSGSIENSSGLVLGAWRDGSIDGEDCIKVKVLKNTKGRAGFTIECVIDGASLTIKQPL